MDKKHFQSLKKTILQINSIVKALDPAIKTQVFDLLKPMIDATQAAAVPPGKGSAEKHHKGGQTVREFYASHSPEKPAKRVRVLAAWIYSQRGNQPFTLDELDQLFDDVGVGRPNRLDMTLKGALEKGNRLFQSVARGKYRPTVHGENYFKEQLAVKPPRG
jgi:hypothetical protein